MCTATMCFSFNIYIWSHIDRMAYENNTIVYLPTQTTKTIYYNIVSIN